MLILISLTKLRDDAGYLDRYATKSLLRSGPTSQASSLIWIGWRHSWNLLLIMFFSCIVQGWRCGTWAAMCGPSALWSRSELVWSPGSTPGMLSSLVCSFENLFLLLLLFIRPKERSYSYRINIFLLKHITVDYDDNCDKVHIPLHPTTG